MRKFLQFLIQLIIGISVFFVFCAAYGLVVKQTVLTQVKNQTLHDPKFENSFQQFVFQLASVPEYAAVILKSIVRGQAITGETLEFSLFQNENKEPGLMLLSSFPKDLDGFLLISQFYGDMERTKIDLIDIDQNKVLHSWTPDTDGINALSKVDRDFMNLERDRNERRHPMLHPLLLRDGSVIYNGSGAPVVRVDVCGGLIWQRDGYFHHSVELDPDGKAIWVPSMIRQGKFGFLDEFYEDDRLTKLSIETGDILYEKSVTEILFENGLENLLTTAYAINQAIHLNDIEPVFQDGDFWMRGDLFLSLRTISTILLFRPDTNKIVWYQQGPWVMQHDVDIVNSHAIALFNNNNLIHDADQSVQITSQLVTYDFETGKVSRPYLKLFQGQMIRSLTGGLITVAENGDVIVVDDNLAHIFRGDEEGNVKWHYWWSHYINWPRYLPEEEFLPIVEKVTGTICK